MLPLKGLVIVANYNQIREIGSVLDRLEKHWPKADVLVVDDGSADGSRELAQSKGYRVEIHPQNMGIGAAIRTGIHFAQSQGYDFVVISSSNGKIRPEDLPSVAGPVQRNEADYTTGSRFMKGGASPGLTPFRRIMIPIFSWGASLLLGRLFSDITCGFRAYRLSIFKDPRLNIEQEWLNRYELEYYVHYWAAKQPIRIREVPVTIPYTHLEKGRKSKIKPFTGWWSMVRPFVLLTLGIRR